MYIIKYFFIFLVSISTLLAQALEPRLYANAPVELNFLALGYVYTDGTLPDNPKADLLDADLDVQIAIAAYAHIFELFQQSAKFDILVPYVKIDGFATYQGQYVSRKVHGMGDIKARFSFNLYGAPALSLKEFAKYKQDLIIGLSFQVSAPTGKYEEEKLVNIGNNRWAFKPSIGISKAIQQVTIELSSAVEFYTDNKDFYLHRKREQDPIYSTQAHLIYYFPKGIWVGVDANYYWGGETTVNGIRSNDKIEDSRYGVSFSLPLSKQASVKFYGNRGISTRTGTDFNMFGIALQYAFGAGL